MEDCNMYVDCYLSANIKQEVKDEIDSESSIKTECVNSQSQRDSTLAVNSDRIKIEQVKLESVSIFDLLEDSVNCINTEHELKIEKSEPKIETRQVTENYDSDTTTNSDVVLERMMNEHVKMVNQNKYAATTKITETMKIVGDDEEVKVKTEIADTDMDVVSSDVEDTGIQQLTEEFGIKNEDDSSTSEVPERMMNKHVKMENQIEYTDTMKITETVKIEGYDEEVKVKTETADTDMDVVSGVSEDMANQQLTEGFEIKDEGGASTAELLESAERHYSSTICSYPDAGKLDMHGVMNIRSSENDVQNVERGAHSDLTLVNYMEISPDRNNAHFDSIYDPEKRSKNTNVARGGLDPSNSHICSQSITRKIYECPNCPYKSAFSARLSRHLQNDCETSSRNELKVCTYCHATFKRKLQLDDHIIKKHSSFMPSVSSKIHDCTRCTYKTTIKHYLDQHMMKHPETVPSCKLSACMHCTASFRTNRALGDHILKKHPDFESSVSSKIHECTYCSYKTTNKSNLDDHKLLHPETSNSRKFSMCVHCNATFRNDQRLNEHMLKKHPAFMEFVSYKTHQCTNCTYKNTDKRLFDDHILKHHPDSVAKVSSKIHACAKCTYKTTYISKLVKHSQTHPESVSSDLFSTCIHCSCSFGSKASLDIHILRKHPDFISSVTSKIHQCANCTYSTISKKNLVRHFRVRHGSEKRLKNANIVPGRLGPTNSYICSQCNFMCQRGIMLDEHIIENHLDSIASITRKIYECPNCQYKTVYSSKMTKHSLRNCETSSGSDSKSCTYCNATFKIKASLDDHIIRCHPDFTASVSSEIHESTDSTNLAKNMLKHPKTVSSYKFSTCIHCSVTFRTNRALGEHILRKHPNFTASVSSKLHECTNCTFKSTMRGRLDAHILKEHPDSIASPSFKMHECAHCHYKTTAKYLLDRHLQTHPESVPSHKRNTCMDCSAVFSDKKAKFEHILRKHPNSTESISYKIHECAKCTYKTTIKHLFSDHVLRKHPDLSATVDSQKYECTNCIYKTTNKGCFDEHILKKHPDSISKVSLKIYECKNCTYKTTNKRQFDNHVLRNHPDLVANASSKTRECMYCTFKTIIKSSFDRHVRTHPESTSSYKSSTCIHCRATFRTKQALDNHILSKHPDFTSSVTSEILECAKCAYKTTTKKLLDNHLLGKHPDSIESVSSNILECANCTYKTVFKKCLVTHMQRHPETFSSSKLSRCTHCSATFEAKKTLDDHILRKHPDFMSSVSSKMYECANCTYKTTFKGRFQEHIFKNHPDIVANFPFKIHECAKCPYKTTVKGRFNRHTRKHPKTILNASRKDQQ